MHRSAIGFITITLCLLALVAHSLAAEKEDKPMSLSPTSSAFAHNGTIPHAYTCDGKDISPPLAWTGIPSETKSLALILDERVKYLRCLRELKREDHWNRLREQAWKAGRILLDAGARMAAKTVESLGKETNEDRPAR